MDQGLLILLFILAASIIGKNNSVSIATGFLIIVKLVNWDSLLHMVNDKFLNIGIIILTMGVLAPIALNKIKLSDIINLIKTPAGIITIASGVIVTVLSTNGLTLMAKEPDIIADIVLGTVIGVSFFKGTPVGPMIAAGIAGLFLYILRLF